MSKLQAWQDSANTPAPKRVGVIDKGKPFSIDNQRIKSNGKGFFFLSRHLNEAYETGLKAVPLRTCLLHHNSDRLWTIKSQPKYFTDLLQTDFDVSTGEILAQSVYRTNDLIQGNNRKIKALNRLKNEFKEQWRKRKVSIFFYTFTVANENGVQISKAFNGIKKRFLRNGHPVKGYCWVLDIDNDSYHIHYHAIIVADRIKCKGKKLPEWLKMDDLWRARCQVQFGHGFNYYLAKYLAKNNWRVVTDDRGKRKRQYGLNILKK
jgi:hypothetical protein